MGASTLKGVLQPKSTFSAHPRVDSKSGRLINFSANQSPKLCNIVVYEFDDDMAVHKQTSFDVPGFVFFHDFIVTEKYYLFVQAPTAFDPLPFLVGLKGPAQCISFDKDKPSILYAVSRDDPSKVQQVPLDAHFNFHFANAFDDENGKIVFDVVWSPDMQLGETKVRAISLCILLYSTVLLCFTMDDM
jgi:all-trans-8'-apo-beta-carotenal 15,15'-oxygenase